MKLPKSSEIWNILKGAIFITLCTLGGGFAVGFINSIVSDKATPEGLLALVGIISLSFGFYIIARKQIVRNWSKLVTMAFIVWAFGVTNILIDDTVTVASWFEGLPVVLLTMGLTCWIVFVCRKTPS
jgi:hypothetical protein